MTGVKDRTSRMIAYPASGGNNTSKSGFPFLLLQISDVRFGSWLCENATPLKRDRRSYSSTTVLARKLASAFNLDDELKNVILVVLRSFAFSHSQGPKPT